MIKARKTQSQMGDNLEVYIPRGEIDMAPIISKLKTTRKIRKELAKLKWNVIKGKICSKCNPKMF